MIRIGILELVGGIAAVGGGVMIATPFPYQGLGLIAFGGFLIWTSIERHDPPIGV